MTSTHKASARAATARRASTFTESVIREMTRVANQYGAINLAQGFPDFPMPRSVRPTPLPSTRIPKGLYHPIPRSSQPDPARFRR